MKFNDLKNKKILILGKGLEGKATFQVIKKFFPENLVQIVEPKTEINLEKKLNSFDTVIKSPGIPGYKVKKKYTTPTNLFFANNNNFTIGVTGSKGKSTTATLIYKILKQAGKKTELIGNIGKTAIDVFLKKIDEETIFVIELSSYQLNDIQFSPNIAVITALFPEHLDYHQNLKNYYQAKKNIIKYCQKNDYFVYLSKYSLLHQWAQQFKGISIEASSSLPFKINNPKILGEHNLDNIKLAYHVAKILKIEDEVIKKSVDNFNPLPHRLEYVGRFKKIEFFDDALSTTPESTMAAINCFDKIGAILLGGQDRGYKFDALTSLIIQKKIPVVISFPDTGYKICQLLTKKISSGYQPKILKTNSMEEAVKFVYQYTPKNSVCLLSTASPSYSLWKNYREKGELFQKFIKKYGY